MSSFRALLAEQRWDDHRYYHHSLVNQSLHMLSACTFVTAYVLAWWDIALASFIGWTVAMTSRQIGHFFFEPKTYDAVNDASHEHKEAIKVGYNLKRKWIFMTLWALSPLLLVASPTLFGLTAPASSALDFVRNVGELWLGLALGGLLFRVAQLTRLADLRTGLVWATKIVTDPFHDIKLYHAAPLRLLKGERLDDGLATSG